MGWALSIVVCAWNVRNKPKTRNQAQSSETKNRGAGVEHRGVCVECSKQTQNSQANSKLRKKNSGVGVEHRGMCVECLKQTQNSKTNPKLGSKK